ncbi:MAG TPA: hypothetical protein VGX25_13060 [Actinophytocola sp.]|uniref:hypothetical protein n=1 Tax=Actinophytocola sp. TaxID=1872138 RepID=UPI002DDD1389|nr:hypothetical protein [Actinophytocola sp.]HEV2780315.1 hypothetical protein [Actinophytocola sp.]
MLVLPHGSMDDSFVLDAARLRVDGDVKLDDGFVAAGGVGLRSARIGGHLLLSGATIGRREAVAGLSAAFAAGRAVERVPVALLADGVEIGGDVEARGARAGRIERDGDPRTAFRAYGQVRLVDAQVQGSASLSMSRLHGPAIDALFADRLRVGGTLFLRRVLVSGSIRLQNAHLGSSLDCSGARLSKPRLRPNGSVKPSLDARVATIGKDLLCGGGFLAVGGVRVRLAEVGKLATFHGARLGGPTRPGHPATAVALSAYGLSAQELVLSVPPGRPPRGRVVLARARAVTVLDGPGLWAASGGVDVEDFGYQSITADPEVGVATRLRWLRAVQPNFAPGPTSSSRRCTGAGATRSAPGTCNWSGSAAGMPSCTRSAGSGAPCRSGRSATATGRGARSPGSRRSGCSARCGSPGTGSRRSTRGRSRCGTRPCWRRIWCCRSWIWGRTRNGSWPGRRSGSPRRSSRPAGSSPRRPPRARPGC